MRTQIIEGYRRASKRLIILDYDGTLVNFTATPEKALPTQKVVDLLQNLIGQRDTRVIVVTGRSHNSIEAFLGQLPLQIISDHGAMVREEFQWRHIITHDDHWKASILGIMNKATESCPGSFIENKPFSLAWHFRNADEDVGSSSARSLGNELQHLTSDFGLKLMAGNEVIEIMPKVIGKGVATRDVLSQENFDYVLCIGDDAADEEIFKVLSKSDISHTVKVGPGNTTAKYRVNQVEDVHSLLNQIIK